LIVTTIYQAAVAFSVRKLAMIPDEYGVSPERVASAVIGPEHVMVQRYNATWFPIA
jgi:hypothetical protein